MQNVVDADGTLSPKIRHECLAAVRGVLTSNGFDGADGFVAAQCGLLAGFMAGSEGIPLEIAVATTTTGYRASGRDWARPNDVPSLIKGPDICSETARGIYRAAGSDPAAAASMSMMIAGLLALAAGRGPGEVMADALRTCAQLAGKLSGTGA